MARKKAVVHCRSCCFDTSPLDHPSRCSRCHSSIDLWPKNGEMWPSSHHQPSGPRKTWFSFSSLWDDFFLQKNSKLQIFCLSFGRYFPRLKWSPKVATHLSLHFWNFWNFGAPKSAPKWLSWVMGHGARTNFINTLFVLKLENNLETFGQNLQLMALFWRFCLVGL